MLNIFILVVIESKSGSGSTIQPDEIYRSYLTSIYDTRPLPADDKYPLQCTKHFVNLKCADVSKHLSREEIKESWSKIVQGKLDRFPRERITMDQIASKVEGKFSKLVVIKGAPGGGKTTLSWELCRRWANGEVWTDYSLVVLLRLRDENVQEAVTLVDLFQCEDTDTSKNVVATIIQNHHGRGILFVLEGLDELPPSLRQKDSIFMKLITGRLLSSCTVLVTTRPWAVCDLPVTCSSRIDQFIEILGFSSEKIQEYIDLMIKDGAPPELREYINSNPHISSAMYNPLHARFVVEFYRENHDKINSVFPNTTTELYTAYSRVLIERYLHDHPHPESHWSGELSDLPSLIQEHFDKLSQIAYNGITKKQQQLVFFKEDGVDANTTLGFMNTVHPLYRSTMKTNSSPSYNFLHLTLQEFLAAIHIWRTFSQQDQLLFIETQSKKYSMIILFLAGLTHFSDPWTKCVLPTPQVDRNESPSEMIVYLNREHILWLYETQNEQLISSFDNVVLPIKLMQSKVDPLYFLALGYCIAVGKFMLELEYSFPDEESVDTFNQNRLHLLAGLKRHNSKCSSQVKVLDIQWSVCPFPDSLYEIIDYIPAATQGVLRVGDSQDMPLASKLSKFLGNVETVAIPSLPDSLEVLRYSRTLKILQLIWCLENSEITGSILNDRITEFCPSLEYLEVKVKGFSRVIIRIDDNDDYLHDPWIIAQSNSQYLVFGLNIKRFKELKRRQLFPSNFGPIFTDEFTEQANKCTDHFADFLKHFGLFTGDNLLPTLGLKHLVSHSLPKCSLLEKLTIDLSSQVVCASRQESQDCVILNIFDNIFKAPRENSSVRELSCKLNVDLRSNSNQIIDEFCALLQQNISLEEIYLEVCDSSSAFLDNNPMPSLILKPIMETVCNLMLKKFVIRVNLIANNDTIVAICNALENNKYLEYLHFPKMSVEPRQRFLLPIANALSKNSSITTLILGFEPTITEYLDHEFLLINSEDSKAVGDMLKVNKTLCFLHLMVDIPDWSPIIDGLKLNTTIRELHIPSSAKKSAIKCIDYVYVRCRIIYNYD